MMHKKCLYTVYKVVLSSNIFCVLRAQKAGHYVLAQRLCPDNATNLARVMCTYCEGSGEVFGT